MKTHSKMTQRILSIVLTLLMVLSLIPTSVMAAETDKPWLDSSVTATMDGITLYIPEVYCDDCGENVQDAELVIDSVDYAVGTLMMKYHLGRHLCFEISTKSNTIRIDDFDCNIEYNEYPVYANAWDQTTSEPVAYLSREAGHVFDEGESGICAFCGEMVQTGWVYDSGNWYYYYEDGTMATDTIISNEYGSYYVGSDGVMVVNQKVLVDDVWYQAAEDGTLEPLSFDNRWELDSDNWYYYYEDGTMATNVVISNENGSYYVGADGALVVNQKVQVDGVWYQAAEDGRLEPLETDTHNYVNGICSDCGEYLSATDENEDGVYEISNAGQLYWFAEFVNAGNTSANAILTADIVVNEGVITEETTVGNYWVSIGSQYNQYTGTFDGNNHVISGLRSDKENSSYVGLFGYVGKNGVVKNTGVINSYFNNYSAIGSVAGGNEGTIINCYNTGIACAADSCVAGVVGENRGIVENCYNTGYIMCRAFVGGVVGYNIGVITNCYNTGTVGGERYIGGMVGLNEGTITNCYYLDTCGASDGNASSKTSEEFSSGEVAYLLQEGQTEEIWGQKLGTEASPTLGGDKVYLVKDCLGNSCYSNTNEDGRHHFINGICTDCGEYQPATDENEDGVFEIGNAGQLYWFAEYVNAGNISANAILTDNIVVNEGEMASNSTDARVWTPIGNKRNKYKGTFDGNNKTVSGLYFNNSEAEYVGLFGYMGEMGAVNGTVKNIGIINSYFKGLMFVGGVVGYAQGVTITNCYNTSTVVGQNYAGGMAGYAEESTVANCYNTGKIEGTDGIGMIGWVMNITVENCYYLNTSCDVGIGNVSDTERSIKPKTAEVFASGEVAYLLQGEQEELVWGQTIGTETAPVLGGDKVYYGYDSCADDAAVYTNNANATDEKLDHIFDNNNGFCTLCDGFEPATDENEDGVYEIGNAGQLYWFADKVNNDNENFGSANAILTADIVVNEGTMSAESEGARVWTPIGNWSNTYTGTFDGNDYTVSGLYFNDSEVHYVGLFGVIGENGAVKNTGVINSYFNADECVGGVSGYNFGTVTNCYSTAKISADRVAGGIVGCSYGIVANSYNTGKVNGNNGVSGVVGVSQFGTIINCYNTGEVSGTTNVGGILGESYSATIANCYNTGTVYGNYYFGAIFGYGRNEDASNCYYLDSSCSFGTGDDSIYGPITSKAKTSEAFASGEVAYLLQSEQEELVWGQKIGTETAPVLGGDKVYYGYDSCAVDATEVYTNNSKVTADKPDHNFVNGSCATCSVNALFYAERLVDYDGDISEESAYFMYLENALSYAEKSTQNITTYYSECATVKILCNYAIDESVTVTVPSNVTLDLNGFELTNNGTINFESIDCFKVSGGNYTGEGTVKIGEYDGIIFENTLYYFGGEYTPDTNVKRDLAKEKDRTYFTAGEGYAIYTNADGAVLNLYNATIYSNKEGVGDSSTVAIYYSDEDTLTVNFYGENNLYSEADLCVMGIEALGGLVLNGLGDNPVLNIKGEEAESYTYGITGNDITINSGTINVTVSKAGTDSSNGIVSSRDLTVANGATLNLVTGGANSISAGIIVNGNLTNNGTISAQFGKAMLSTGVLLYAGEEPMGIGTINAIVLGLANADGETPVLKYYTSGEALVYTHFAPATMIAKSEFLVSSGSTLVIREDAVADLTLLSAEDITIEDEVAIDGSLLLPEGISVLDIKDNLTSPTGDGTVCIGENRYYYFENGNLKCGNEGSHFTAEDSENVANCKHKAVCDICGAEYGYTNDNHIGEIIPKFDWDNPYDGECYVYVEFYCSECGDYIDSASGYAALNDTVEAEDCMHPGSELYEVSFEYESVTYKDTKSFTIKSDNHIGEIVNGFCSECGGYEPATLNDNGTPDDEWDDYYEISNAGQLYWFGEVAAANDNYSKAVLTDDIIVNEDLTAENLREWIAIGESSSMPYCGTFDGQGHFISGLYAKSELNYIGLFGAIGWGAEISNLGIKDSYFEGNYYVGGIAGYNDFSYIKNCYAENVEIVTVSSGAAVVGYNYGEVSNSYSTSDSFVGNNNYGTITNCYYLADEEIHNEDGLTFKTAEQFASGEVAYLLQSGVVGEEIWDDELGEYVQTEPEHIWGQKIGEDTYPVFGGDKVYTVNNCIDEVVGYSNTKNVNGGHCAFENGFCTGCGDFEPATLNEDGVYEIGNVGQLYWFAEYVNAGNVSADAILTADIVVNEGTITSESTDARAWTPIGNWNNKYTGTFDGNDYTVSGLYFNDSEVHYVGLFGVIGENGAVKNTGVINSYFNADECVGGVSGYNFGTVTNCYSTAKISADRVAGGIVGCNYGIVANSYNTGKVNGNNGVSGVVGVSQYGTIINCYNTGEVSGTTNVGGILGESYSATIANCYNTGTVDGDYYFGAIFGYGRNYDASNCYYLDSSCRFGTGDDSIYGPITSKAKTSEAFATGEVAYLLQSEQTESVWGQTIGTDELPVLGGDKVYYVTNCKSENIYSNTNENDQHNVVDDSCTNCGLSSSIVMEIKLLKLAIKRANEIADENNVLESKKEPLDDIYQDLLAVGKQEESGQLSRLDLVKMALSAYNKKLQAGIADGTWVKADYTEIDAAVAEIESSGATTDKMSAKLDEIKSELSVMKESSETSKADVDVLMKEVETLKDCVSGNHIFENGKCTICGAEEHVDKLAGYTISLGDKIAVNYYMSLTEKTLNDANAKMVFTVPDTGSTYTVEIPVSEAVKNSDYYVFTCEVAAKEMTSVIKAKLVTSTEELVLDDYTVQKYAEYILANPDTYADEQALVKAMLNYGAYAQVYFNYNTDDLANDTEYMTDEEKTLVEELDLSAYSAIVEGAEDSVTFYGATLSLESETAIKLYFIVEGDVSALTVTVNGEETELVKNGNLYELKISDISAHLLKEMYEVKVGGLTITYGAMSYANTALSTDNSELKDAVKSLWLYAQAASDYISVPDVEQGE